MQDAGVRACRDDAVVGDALRTVLTKGVQQLGFELVFVQTRLCRLHRADVTASRDRGGFAHDVEFRGILDQSHLRQGLAQVQPFDRRGTCAAGFALRQPDPVMNFV